MRRLAGWWLIALLAVGVFAPLLANDVPLVAKVDGSLRFPAFASYLTQPDIGPYPDRSTSWKEWWARGDEFAVMPPWPYGPLMEREVGRRNEPPTLEHPLGMDDVGRDLLSRMVWGTSTAFWIGFGVLLVAALIGIPLGALAGYRGGVIDAIVSVIIEVFLCFPALVLVLCTVTLVGNSPLMVVLVLGLVYWTGFARLVRGEFLSLREREFVLAARGLGVSPTSLLLRHMLPRITGPLTVNAAFLVAGAIVVQSTLSFLGFGAGDSWGTILVACREPALHGGAWHLWVFPALALVSTVCCLHSVADRAREQAR